MSRLEPTLSGTTDVVVAVVAPDGSVRRAVLDRAAPRTATSSSRCRGSGSTPPARRPPRGPVRARATRSGRSGCGPRAPPAGRAGRRPPTCPRARRGRHATSRSPSRPPAAPCSRGRPGGASRPRSTARPPPRSPPSRTPDRRRPPSPPATPRGAHAWSASGANRPRRGRSRRRTRRRRPPSCPTSTSSGPRRCARPRRRSGSRCCSRSAAASRGRIAKTDVGLDGLGDGTPRRATASASRRAIALAWLAARRHRSSVEQRLELRRHEAHLGRELHRLLAQVGQRGRQRPGRGRRRDSPQAGRSSCRRSDRTSAPTSAVMSPERTSSAAAALASREPSMWRRIPLRVRVVRRARHLLERVERAELGRLRDRDDPRLHECSSPSRAIRGRRARG